MKNKELRELSLTELQARLRELRDEMRHLRIQQSTEQLENSARLGTVRREIARVLTFTGQKAAKA
jgi:large subunit ribosomal protein L29